MSTPTPTLLSPTASKARITTDEKLLLGLVVASVVLMNVPYGHYPLYPFKLFATWIHETFHGLAAIATGGSVQSIDINADTSGLTRSFLSPTVWSQGLVSSMGYMGTALVGAMLLSMRRHAKVQRWTLFVIALGMVGSLVFWVRNPFGMVTTAVLAVGIGFLALRGNDRWASIGTNVLASQACINALLDIRVLYSVQGQSDAAAMATSVGLWPWFWATLWLVSSLVLFWVAWSRTAARAVPP